MPTVTSGRSFYQTDDVAGSSITYGFDSLSDSDIVVVGIDSDTSTRTILEESVNYTLSSSTKTITCLVASWATIDATFDLIRVYRASTTQALVDFKNGGTLSETDLDNAYKQSLFVAQEVSEDASDLGTGGPSVITTAYIEDNAVTTAKLAALSVTEAKLAASSVTTAKIADDAVTTAKIADDAVTSAKIVDDAVTTAKIADDAITYAKVDVATTAEMEGQSTAGVVTPDVLKYSPFSPRAYGVVTYDTSAPALESGSYNVGSVSEPSEDVRRITFTTALDDANYTVVAIMEHTSTNSSFNVEVISKTATYFDLESSSNDATSYKINFVVFGSTLSS
jgi:hypothetical protein